MKKLLTVILSLSIAVTMLSGLTTFAEKEITVELDGTKIDFDVNPEIIDGRTMVPLRKIFEEIGALVKWDNDTRTVSARKNSKTITLAIDSADLQIDKGKTDDAGNPVIETVSLDVPAQIVSDRTLVPARAISESFGLSVDWDEDNQKVIISSENNEDESWKENIGSINLTDLTFDGNGIEINGNQIKITQGGDFTLTGKLTEGNITISTKERVKLRLSDAEITSSEGPCIFVEEADKAYITVSEGTQNSLVAENSEDGAIYSKENLEIKGDGTLKIESLAGHGIKASDNLTIENSVMDINATSDGIHINDTFKMTGGIVNITATCDGIDSESIVNISGGKINIETNGVPIETEQPDTTATQEFPNRWMQQEAADVEFEKSTKGINAEWMLYISGAEINVNSASHAIHCQDEIQIDGGNLTLSSKYDKGISAHGNLTVNGEATVIDVTKSTEGIESKNVMTINDGTIKVISTDDAINATGGNSGMMGPGGNFGGGNRVPPEGLEKSQSPQLDGQISENGEANPMQGTRPQRGHDRFHGNIPPEMIENGEFKPPFEMPEGGEFTPPEGQVQPFEGGMMPDRNFGGMGRNMKECLIINGGYFELCGTDDCIDANGSITINGGTVKASNPKGTFYGNFGVIDSDGQVNISENANLILASQSGNERSLKLTQNIITVYCENNHTKEDKITVSDSNGKIVYEYTPGGSYKSVMIASEIIKTGEKYSITTGDEVFETEISQQSTVIGTPPTNGKGFGRGQFVQ